MITFNGALVQDTATGEDLIKETLTYDDYLDIELLSRKLVCTCMLSLKKVFTNCQSLISAKYTVHEASLVNMPVYYRTPEEMVGKEIVKIMMIDEPEVLDAAIAQLPASLYEHYTVVKSRPFYLEIMNKKVQQGHCYHSFSRKVRT